MLETHLVSGFDEGEFTYDDYDDMVRDVRNYTSKLDLSSPAAADRAVEDLSVRDRLEQIHETTDRDLDFDPPSSEPFGDPPVGSPSDTSPGRQGQVGVPARMVALDVVRVVVLLRVVDVVRVVVLHLVVDVVALRRSVPLPDQRRMHPMREQ